MRAIAASLGFLALMGCETVRTEYITPPCPASALAETEAAPVLELTPEQRQAIDVAVISAVGFDPALSYIRHHDVEVPARTRRLEQRIADTREWCAKRSAG